MKRTFKDACEYLADTVKNGLSPESEHVKRRVNHCQEDLMMRLSSKYKRTFMMLYSQNGYITCPASVERIIKCAVEGAPRTVYSEAYQFLDYGPGANERLKNGRYGDLTDLGSNYASFFDPHVPMRLMAFSDSLLDTDVTIQVQGATQDTHLTTVTSFENEGHAAVELKVTPRYGTTAPMVWSPENASEESFCRIDAMVKKRTHGNIVLVGWVEGAEDAAPLVFPLGKYGKNERVPNYHRYKIAGYDSGSLGVYALVELAHTDMVDDNEILSVQNLAALKAESRSVEVMEMDSGRGIHYQNIATKLVRDQLSNIYDQMSAEITFDIDVAQGPRGL